VLSPLASEEWNEAHDLVLDSNWDVFARSVSGNRCLGRGFDGEPSPSRILKPPAKIFASIYVHRRLQTGLPDGIISNQKSQFG
jgi:hypothetical protein